MPKTRLQRPSRILRVSLLTVTITSASFTADGVSADGVSGVDDTDESAIAYVNAINSFSGQSGVTARVLANVVTLADYTSGNALSSGVAVYINGVAVQSANYAADDTGAGSFVTAINNISTQTGVSATQDSTNNRIILTASDGRNIHVRVDEDTGSSAVSGSGMMGLAFSQSGGTAVFRGTFTLTSDDTFTLSGAAAEISSATAVGQDATTTLNNINVATSTNAQTAIFILDNVIRQLQQRRTDVGSKSIRMQIAETELQIRSENLTASESRIRDADIASETAALTAAQILQQAGASVLARANATPQIALTLLQG